MLTNQDLSTSDNDQRITPIGKQIRRFKLDVRNSAIYECAFRRYERCRAKAKRTG